MSAMGLNGAIGSAATQNEPGHDLTELEGRVKETSRSLRIASEVYSAAIDEHSQAQRELLRARRENLEAMVHAALMTERAVLDATIQRTSDQIRSASGIVVEKGRGDSWGHDLDGAIGKAKAAVTNGEIPAAIVIRGLDQSMGNERPAGVGLFLDLSDRLPQPDSAMTASERARRNGRR